MLAKTRQSDRVAARSPATMLSARSPAIDQSSQPDLPNDVMRPDRSTTARGRCRASVMLHASSRSFVVRNKATKASIPVAITLIAGQNGPVPDERRGF